MNMNLWHRYGKLMALLAASAGLLLLWSIVIPIYEGPDEQHHWHYALYLNEQHRLPLYTPELAEANSPPLYYLLIAPFAFDPAEPKAIFNNSMISSDPPRFFNDYSKDLTEYRSIRFARVVSVVLSVLAVFFCFLSGVEATGNQVTGLLAGGMAAFLPQFSFRGMSVSNDALVTLMCAITTYLIVRLIKRGFSWRLGIMAAVTSALAFLSKTNAIFLPIPLSLALISTPGTWKARLGRLSVLGITLLIVAPWLIRNQVLYGDPLASRIMLTVVANLVNIKPITSPYFLTVFPINLYFSFVGFFGAFSILLPKWLYATFGLLGVLAVFGYVLRAIHHQMDTRLTLILLTFPVLSLAITVYINLSFNQPQGRYLFPALTAIALLIALGLEGLPFWNKRLTYLLLGVLLLVNLSIVGKIIIPAYWG